MYAFLYTENHDTQNAFTQPCLYRDGSAGALPDPTNTKSQQQPGQNRRKNSGERGIAR